jgi:hypothetical protein
VNLFTDKVTLSGSHIASLKLASFALAFFLASFFPLFVQSWRWIWLALSLILAVPFVTTWVKQTVIERQA